MLQCHCIGVAPIPVNDEKVMPVQCCVSASLCNRLNTQCDICTIHAQDKRAFVGREANTDMTQRGLVAGTHQPRSLSNWPTGTPNITRLFRSMKHARTHTHTHKERSHSYPES